MRLFALLAIILLALFSQGAAAAIVGFPSTITFYEEPIAVDFIITNPSAAAAVVSVQLFAPVEAQLIAPESIIAGNDTISIAAGKDANVSLVLSPQSELTGQAYKGALAVGLGSTETRQNIDFVFRSASEKPVTAAFGGFDANTFGGAVSGAASFFSGISKDIAVDIALAVVVIVLVIALVARIRKRVTG